MKVSKELLFSERCPYCGSLSAWICCEEWSKAYKELTSEMKKKLSQNPVVKTASSSNSTRTDRNEKDDDRRFK